MVDPTRHRQLEELNQAEVCSMILSRARNELYLNMRFLDLSLSCLGYEASQTIDGIGTDGYLIYYHPDYLIGQYRQGRVRINRAYLHMVLHCLFCHLDTRRERDPAYWGLSCDIAIESIIDGLYMRCVHIQPGAFRRTVYLSLGDELRVLSAQGIYHALRSQALDAGRFHRLAGEFRVDSHQMWEQDMPPSRMMSRQNKWKENREKLQTEMETGSREESQDTKSLLEQVQIENRERYDYKRFLRKFAVLREELQIDPDSFDYGFYTYGLSLYGNMPLIEPLETREISRIEDFVIVIDTSMSCSGDLVKRFLEETYDVLSESESYFRRINVHIIQCDDQVQQDQVITKAEEMKAYMDNFTVIGQGGTDFRPAFEYVSRLSAAGAFHKLRGLIYFTDGKGIYPVKNPPYDTAFVFIEDQYCDSSVPPWAIKLVLTSEDLEETSTIRRQL